MTGTNFHDRFRIDGVRIDANIAGLITSAIQTRTMDGAASVTITLHDPDRIVLRSGLLSKAGRPSKRQRKLENFDQAAWARFAPARASLDGWFLRLAGVSKQGPTLTLTFEDEIAHLMRRQTDPIKSTRHAGDGGDGGVTRAQFIKTLLIASTKRQVGYVAWFSPEHSEVQSTKQPDADPSRQKGIDPKADLTVKGVPIDAAQRHNLTTGLQVADDLLASDLATLAWIVAVIQESEVRNLTDGHSSSVGILQLLDIHLGGSTATKGGRRDVELVTRMFFKDGFWGKGGAIELAKQHPDWTPGQVAQACQGSAFPDAYDVWADEATAILDAWGGVSQIVTSRRRYTFKAGGKRDHEQHNYWDDAGDLAREVNWRLFADENILFYVSDNWLFGRQPVLKVDPDDPAIADVDFDADTGTPISEIIVTARSPRWTGSPGACAQVTGMGPVDGRWLLFEHTHDLLTSEDSYTLHRPAPKYKEPAADTRSRSVEADDPLTGSARDRIVKAAQKAYRLDQQYDLYRYDQVRPYPRTLFPANFRSPQGIVTKRVITDCSGFATLCYKAAGVGDPNGLGYNGQGWTGTLLAHGSPTRDPKPGDLAFYNNPEHVGVYIGGGMVIEFGGDPGPLKVKATYRPVAQYRTYDLSDA